MNKISFLHPFLLGTAIILIVFAHNQEQLSIINIALPVIITLLASLAVFFLSLIFVKNKNKAALITSVALLFFFSYGAIYAPIESLIIKGFVIGRIRYFVPVWTMVFLLVAYFIIRTKSLLSVLTQSVMVMAMVLVFFPVFDIARFNFQQRNFIEALPFGKSDNTLTNADNINFPNIYNIILDGYARLDTLKDLFNYDNSEFIKYLRGKGFYTSDVSRSNYARTFLSLSSSLNMRYLDDISKLDNEETQFLSTYRLIRNNEVTAFLKSQGYEIIHFRSGWDQTDYNQSADENITCGNLNEFMSIIIRMTPISILDKKFHFIGGDIRERILCTLDRLGDLASFHNKPFYSFAHLLLPHAPYVFGPNGENIAQEQTVAFDANFDDKDLYLGQLQYLNKLIIQTIDKIVSYDPNAIIIIQSDHGSASSVNESNLESEPTEIFLKERMGNFMVIRAPKLGSVDFSNMETSVNLFRVLFNKYFDASYEVLPQKSFYSSPNQAFNFKDVTDVVLTLPVKKL